MIKVSVLFAAGEGKSFDMDYYVSTHRALVHEAFGEALLGFEVQKGLSGPFPGSEPPFLAIGQLLFDSVDTYLGVMMQGGPALLQDLPNFTNITPAVVVSEIVP
jgi:uncharacterized protein (TIGR02118 family)